MFAQKLNKKNFRDKAIEIITTIVNMFTSKI